MLPQSAQQFVGFVAFLHRIRSQRGDFEDKLEDLLTGWGIQAFPTQNNRMLVTLATGKLIGESWQANILRDFGNVGGEGGSLLEHVKAHGGFCAGLHNASDYRSSGFSRHHVCRTWGARNDDAVRFPDCLDYGWVVETWGQVDDFDFTQS